MFGFMSALLQSHQSIIVEKLLPYTAQEIKKRNIYFFLIRINQESSIIYKIKMNRKKILTANVKGHANR